MFGGVLGRTLRMPLTRWLGAHVDTRVVAAGFLAVLLGLSVHRIWGFISYQEQAAGLMEGGVDMLLLETSQDTINVKAGLEGIDRAFAELGEQVPVSVQGTVEPMGTLLAGQDAEAFYTSLAHRDLLWIGFNCATGPEFMTDHIRTLAGLSRFPVACVPNAGLPDEDGNYNETPEMMAATVTRFLDSGWLNLVGGCCGTTPEHIRLLAQAAEGRPPRQLVHSQETRVSGIEALVVDEDTRPAIVGERTNVLGSRRFRRLIGQGAFEEAAEVGRRQVRNGAHILDVCLQDPDRDEPADMTAFLDLLTKKVKAPIMIDTTDAAVIELALKRLQGKSIINSVNLEDGESRFQTVVPLARRYGAARKRAQQAHNARIDNPAAHGFHFNAPAPVRYSRRNSRRSSKS